MKKELLEQDAVNETANEETHQVNPDTATAETEGEKTDETETEEDEDEAE